jgi:hypothetical protein
MQPVFANGGTTCETAGFLDGVVGNIHMYLVTRTVTSFALHRPAT